MKWNEERTNKDSFYPTQLENFNSSPTVSCLSVKILPWWGKNPDSIWFMWGTKNQARGKIIGNQSLQLKWYKRVVGWTLSIRKKLSCNHQSLESCNYILDNLVIISLCTLVRKGIWIRRGFMSRSGLVLSLSIQVLIVLWGNGEYIGGLLFYWIKSVIDILSNSRKWDEG